jgi:hypothetical protein
LATPIADRGLNISPCGQQSPQRKSPRGRSRISPNLPAGMPARNDARGLLDALSLYQHPNRADRVALGPRGQPGHDAAARRRPPARRGQNRDQRLVFTTEAGTPINPTNLRKRSFAPLLQKANLQTSRACASTISGTRARRCSSSGTYTPSTSRNSWGTRRYP